MPPKKLTTKKISKKKKSKNKTDVRYIVLSDGGEIVRENITFEELERCVDENLFEFGDDFFGHHTIYEIGPEVKFDYKISLIKVEG